MSLESFKAFVRERPALADAVANKNMTWQGFYEMYELYGPNHDVWQKYLISKASTTNKNFSFKDIFNTFQSMNMEDIQKGINSIQKGINYVKDIVDTKTEPVKKSSYEPRPIYKYFDD